MINKVSIIVPCYNQENFLQEALQSVAAQSYSDWECIIVDDGSTDGSAAVAARFLDDPRFRYYKMANGGVSRARNFGILQSAGVYILPLDGDDKISPDFLEEAVKVMQEADVKLIYGTTELFGKQKGKWADNPYDYKRMLHVNMIPCTAMYRRRDYDQTKGYNENMKAGLEDWDFWLDLLDEKSRVIKIKNIHLYYRRQKSSRSKGIGGAVSAELQKLIVRNHREIYDRYFPDVITLYNENYYLKKSPLIYEVKKIARKLFPR